MSIHSIGKSGGSGLFQSLEISSAGMRAERRRMDVIASNIANSSVTRTSDGKGPYRRRVLVYESVPFDGVLSTVSAEKIVLDPTPGEVVFRPGHPDARPDGTLEMPNVNVAFEMVDMILAARTYEANLTASRSFKDMVQKALSVLR